MKDPIKIIHKFKNNNKRIQYKNYIYIGPLVPNNIMKILESIKEKDFYTTLNTISQNDYNQLEKYYGEFWYEKFFISYHIYSQRDTISNTNTKKRALETKYGKEWVSTHIMEPPVKKVSYSFASSYYNYLLMRNKIKTQTRKVEMDFRTYGDIDKTVSQKLLIQETINESEDENEQVGGDEESKDEIVGTDIADTVNVDTDKEEEEVKVMSEEDFQDHVEDNFDLEDLSKLYTTVEVESSKVISETSKLISEALNDKKWDKELENLTSKYNNSQDNLSYDAKLEDVFNKEYITEQYIFKDDTIKAMRNKIAVSLPISQKYGKTIKLLPETQYFWSEYNIDNKEDFVMLGQKWIRRNELLKIDIKPNENIKVYEKLRNNLSYLKDTFGYKIKREDDETNIIRFYENYITMNEIFMLDIYNELGLNYNPESEEKRNLYDVYINIYFPMITYERLEQIIQMLSGKNEKEIQYIELQFGTIKNDVKLETEIETTVENAKIELGKFDKLFSENHIIHSIIHVNTTDPKNITGTTSETKFNLYRIFDNFIVSPKYPFIQYQTPDSQLTYKFYSQTKKEEANDILIKWFENITYGISFKIKLTNNNMKTEDKYIGINLHESGRIEYKMTWKEEDEATVDNIKESFEYVRDLLKKINSENKKIKIMAPPDDRFKFAFINTIQKFTLPEKFRINHNDISEFARFFYPYVSLVIEPKKRKSKTKEDTDESSKYGTYLRYKRISKYENRTKMHLRILYFLRNYDLSDKELIDEISKQFNITVDVAAKELDFVREKYQKGIKKSKKLLKKFKALPKSKPPGIGVDIQGRDRDKYKIRITGARTKEQLDEIIDFMKVLIFLYVETYLYKKKEYQKLKDTLKLLTKIARRRNKVIEIVDYEMEITSVKAITALDKARLGFRPEKGQNQWTRLCQNSGNDKKRRPDITPDNQIEKLLKEGYKLNNETGFYEKEVEIKIRGKMFKTRIRAIKLPGADNTVNFYSCDPSQNKEHIYIGFLAKGSNPNDLCMPCCFKKDHLHGDNKAKKDYYLRCLGTQAKEEEGEKLSQSLGDKLYILQDTNKIQEGRFILLPKYLDIFFNKIWKHDNKIQNHYLSESKSGYFFKYTVKHDTYHFLIAIANIFEKPINEIINSMIDFLKNDKNKIYFTYLNNGDISESFKNPENLIEFIKNSEYLEYDIVGELLSIPGVITPNGINYFIFNKQLTTVKKILEKEKVKEKYYLDCLNTENYEQYNEDRDTVILIREGKYYFPIYRVQKDSTKGKKMNLQKYYTNDNLDDKSTVSKIIEELKNYHSTSCKSTFINKTAFNYTLSAKNIINKLKNIKIVKQYIDERNKCKYIELENGLYIPVKPSGISYSYPFSFYKSDNKEWLKLEKTINLLNSINKVLELDYTPKMVFYDKKENDKIRIISILLNNNLIIPIVNEVISEKKIKDLGLSTRFQPLEETINKEIMNYKNEQIYDDRTKSVKEHNYMTESYNLFRLELSLYLSENDNIREKIISIVRVSNINTKEKKHELRKILLEIIEPKLLNQYKISNQKGGSQKGTLAHLVDKIPNLENYQISNVRDYCKINNTENKCSANTHCLWKNNICKIRLIDTLAVDFVNKIIEEIIQDGIKFKELIQESNYYVSDIVDYTQYTNRDDQKIIKASSHNINKIMSELFGKDKIPVIGRKIYGKMMIAEEEVPELLELGKQLVQQIVSNKDSIIRAYINCYYWINNPLYDTESRNLGYVNNLQTNLTYLFKAQIIDFIQTNLTKGNDAIRKYLEKYFKNDGNFFESTLNKFRKTSINTDGKVELFILSHLIPLPIVVYDNFSNVKFIFLQGEIEVNKDTIARFTSDDKLNKTVFLKFEYDTNSTIPRNIYSIYYI
jgi:hypothetical protein